MDAHVLKSASDGAGEPVPGLRLAVEPLRAPAVAEVEAIILLAPGFASSSGAQQRRVVVPDDHRFHLPTLGQAERGEIAPDTVALLCVKEAAVLHVLARPKHLAPRAFHDVIPGVVAEAAQWHRATDRLGLGRE